jgi:hypothetical protein
LGRLALAAFVKRPQAVAQIGAMAQTYNALSGLVNRQNNDFAL